MSQAIVPWQAADHTPLPISAKQPDEFVPYAIALKQSEQIRVLSALKEGLYDLATEYIWKRAMSRLRQALASLGMQFIGEMLGRSDINEFSSVEAVLTDWDTIRLAENLGVISQTGALRLRHTFELLAHFAQTQDNEELSDSDAVSAVRHCVQYVLTEQNLAVALDFSRLRDRLLSETIPVDDVQIASLFAAPPFFLRTTLRVLIASIKADKGAKLQHALANLDMLLPGIWEKIGEDARWAVGATYAAAASAGKTEALSWMRQSLMRVSGFDYVPENLRSNTFKLAAQSVKDAHHSFNNYHLEVGPTKALATLGTVIPAPALIDCVQAYLCVFLGNYYGRSWAAVPIAEEQLKRIPAQQWHYYLFKVLPNDSLILGIITDERPSRNLCTLIQQLDLGDLPVEPEQSAKLVRAAKEGKNESVVAASKTMLARLR